MHDTQRTYLPAAGHDWTLPFYDPLVKLFGADAVRRVLLDQAAVRPNHRVLDIGCGTGTLVTLIKRFYPGVDVVGLDPDPKALTRARKKAARAGVSIRLDQGFSDELPYPDASFDRVFSSFMFHHLRAEDREKALREVRRVLKPGGSLHLLDFKGAEADEGGWLSRWFQSIHRLRDNSAGRILTLINNAGFVDSLKVAEGAVLLGHLRVAYYQASSPIVSVKSGPVGGNLLLTQTG
jgi:ubiquinone/menaquinone biosynthesis C-methylase UbiE